MKEILTQRHQNNAKKKIGHLFWLNKKNVLKKVKKYFFSKFQLYARVRMCVYECYALSALFLIV